MRLKLGTHASVFLHFLAVGSAFSQGTPSHSPAIRALAVAVERGDTAAEGLFWARVASIGSPLIEPDPLDPQLRLLTFVFRAPASMHGLRLISNLNAIQIRGLTTDFFADSTLGRFSLIPGSTTWYATYRVSAALRIPYLIGVQPRDTVGLHLTPAAGDDGYLDPSNLHIFGRGLSGVETSIVALDAAPAQPWRQSALRPLFDTVAVGAAGFKRKILVWTPSGSGKVAEQGSSILIAISAGTFLERIPTPDMLAYLIRSGEVRSTLLVVVPEPDGSDELSRYEGMTAFLADTVLPAIRTRYPVSHSPQDVVATGTSRRGLVAAVAAMNRPEAIGAVLTLSGSFYWAPPGEARYEWLPARVAREPRKPLRWFVASGSLETVVTPGNHGHYMVGTNRHLNDVLIAKGYTHFYEEFAGVHHEANWEDALATGLRLLLPRH